MTVRAVFPRAWHLQGDEGWVLTISTAPYDGPLGVRIAAPSLEGFGVRPGMAAVLGGDAVTLGTLRLSLHGAIPWAPDISRSAPVDLVTLRGDLQAMSQASRTAARGGFDIELLFGPRKRTPVGAGSCRARPPFGSPSPGEHHGRWGTPSPTGANTGTETPSYRAGTPGDTQTWTTAERLQRLRCSVEAGDTAAAASAVPHLIGLGGGLTPSGDDVLCGLLITLHALRSRWPAVAPTCLDMAGAVAGAANRTTPGRTTALSRTLLHWAARGVAVGPLHALVSQIGTKGTGEAINTLLSVGHTSGSDMLTGVALAATAALGWGESDGPAVVCPA